jgi:hypothetical protein
MAKKKYGDYFKKLEFTDDGYGSFRQGIRLDGAALGLDVCIEYGTWRHGGWMGKGLGPHTHDYDQVLYWFGADPDDMGELGAEVELFLGPEKEKHMITSTAAVHIPKGLVHFPANITRMDGPFCFMAVSCAPEYAKTDIPSQRAEFENRPAAGWGSDYGNHVLRVPFVRKGAWHYGQTNQDDSGGSLGSIRWPDAGFDFLIMCESIWNAPYRFGPNPEKPHVHRLPEILIFMGTDTEDISCLGGEVELAMGREAELHTITEPTAVVVPGGLPHCPLTVTRLDQPIILTDVRPLGTEPPSRNTP